MLFLTFLFPYRVVNAQKYIIITLTNARAIHSHSPLVWFPNSYTVELGITQSPVHGV